MLDSQIIPTKQIDFDQMLLEQGAQANTADALQMLIRMAEQVGASHVAQVLRQRLESQHDLSTLPRLAGIIARKTISQLIDNNYKYVTPTIGAALPIASCSSGR